MKRRFQTTYTQVLLWLLRPVLDEISRRNLATATPVAPLQIDLRAIRSELEQVSSQLKATPLLRLPPDARLMPEPEANQPGQRRRRSDR